MDDLGIICGSTLYEAHSCLLLLNAEVDTKLTSWSMILMMAKMIIMMTFENGGDGDDCVVLAIIV